MAFPPCGAMEWAELTRDNRESGGGTYRLPCEDPPVDGASCGAGCLAASASVACDPANTVGDAETSVGVADATS